MPRHILLCLALGLCLAANADASKVKVWQQNSQSAFDKAKFNHAVVTSEGALRLSRQVKPLAGLDAAHVWAVAEDAKGNLYAATGDAGKLFKINGDKASVVYASGDSQVLSLAVGPDGSVYAGTGPSGKIIRVTPDGAKPRVIADGLDTYVWALAFDADNGTLYAGTGPKGKIYAVTPDAKGEKVAPFYTTRQEHVLCLALGGGGTLYAGTDKGGLVYRIDRAAKGFVLYHAHQTEVRSLLWTPEALYAGTSSPVARKTGGSSTSSKGSPLDERPASNPGSGENSLYRIAPDGTVRELYRDRTMVLCLARQDGTILAGTGMQGQLFAVNDRTKERSEIARLDHGQIHCMLQRKDGSVVLGTGDPGKLYVLEHRYATKGTVLSEVLDTKLMSRWGTMTWKAATPAGTTVSVAVRAGNVAEPDDTWSPWSSEQTDPAAAKALAPTARYLQYRVTLTTEKAQATPEFRHFAVRYQTTNQAPEITSLDVPDLDTTNLDNPKKLKLRWSATDPNDDELTYALYFRKDGWKDWVLLEENLEKRDFEWDTTGVPAGLYQVKLVASDRKDNAPEDCFAIERISAPVPVAHVPPTVALKLAGFDGDRAILEATATDPLVRLTEASFAVNGKRWANVFPTDGLFDSKSEQFRFKTESLRPGTNVVVLRVRDAAGNLGSADVVFAVPGKK